MDSAVTFIHAADLHLDSLFKGLRHVPANIFKEIQESTFTALNHLVDEAINNNVDFVLLAGDLYDHESQSLKAQIRLRRAFERLAEQNIDVFLSYGNHDFMKGDSFDVEYPDNVHIFSEERVTCIPFYKTVKQLQQYMDLVMKIERYMKINHLSIRLLMENFHFILPCCMEVWQRIRNMIRMHRF